MKKVRSLFAVFALLTLASSGLHSQTTFRMSYDAASFDIAGGMVENPAGDFVFTGLNSTFFPFFGNTIKVDNTGNIIWAKSYTGGVATNFSDIKNVSSGGYIITGSSSSGGAVLVRIDDNGNVLWAKRYQLPNLSSGKTSNEFGNAVIETSDGGFLVGGGVDYFWDGVSASTVDTSSAMGFKVDVNGNLLWNKVWTIPTANPDEHYINDVAESSDGYFFAGQSSEGSGTMNSNGDYPSNSLLIKTTKTGALTYMRRWGTGDSKFQNINSAICLANGNILLGGNDDFNSFLVTLNGTGSSPSTTGLTRKINGSVFPPRTLIIQDIMENADGNYSVIGMQIEPLSVAFYTAIYKINKSTGALIFGRGYSPIGLSSIMPEGGLAADQGYYMVMTDQQSTGFNYNIIRTDPTGQLGVPAGCGSTNLTPGTGSYSPTFSTPGFSEFSLAIESTFTPVVNNLSPTKIQHCQVIACAPPPAPATVSASLGTICAGQSSSLSISNPDAGVTYQVFTSSTGGTSVGTLPLTVSPGTSTTYYIESSLVSNPVCVSTTRTPVTVNVTPLPSASASSNSTCLGGTLLLTATGGGNYSWAGPNGFTSTSQNPSVVNATAAASGTYTVSVTVSGCTATSTVNVSINPSLTAAAGSNGPVCDGAALNLTSSGGTSYSWTGPNAYSSNSQNPVIGTVSSVVAGTYTVTVTSGTCSATSTVAVSVTPLPVAVAGGNNPVCEGSTLNLTSSGGTTYSWTGPNGFTSNVQNPILSAATPAAAGVYTVTVTESGCSATSTTSISITPSPAASASVNASNVCEGSVISLSASGGTTYSWTGPNGFNSSLQNPTVSDATPSAAGTYTVIVTSSGCSATSTVSVALTNAPPAAAGSSGMVCVGTTLNLNASGGTGYSWAGPNGFTSTTQNPTITGISALGSGTYTVTVTGSSGCTATSAVAVSVLNAPTATIAGNTSVCAGNAVTLTASGGGTYSWSNGSSTSVISVSPSTPTLYWVLVSIGSCTDSTGILISVDSIPTITTASNGPVCEGGTLNLTASAGTSYSWMGPGGYTSNLQNPSITPTAPGTSGVYTVTVTGANSCTTTGTVAITINSLPVVSIAGTTNICSGSATTLTASGANTYSWNTGNTLPSISVSPTSATGYTVTGTDANGCSSTQTLLVNVTTPPVATITGNLPICAGQTLILTASGGSPYLWSNGQTTQSITVSPTASTQYNVIVGSGCTDTASITVTVNPLPTLVTSGDITIIRGTNTTLTAGGGTTYSWTPSTGLSCDTCATPVATPTETTTYCVEARNAGGCVSNACMTVTVDILCGELFVPKAFSPNNDGQNEIEYVMGNCITDLEFAIFDRWGEKVFTTNDITIGWDGTYHGEKLDAAVFVYYLKAKVKGVEVNKHGNITLVK
ncbi:MAG: gliding motility-associated C-terminal domain-containing protein [Bacteroidia bacterium]|nr:gliding motility-associated C-terminal domain-containing protein [Bacteroidia bacterium]